MLVQSNGFEMVQCHKASTEKQTRLIVSFFVSSDSASPYCYTRYWITGGNTPTEVSVAWLLSRGLLLISVVKDRMYQHTRLFRLCVHYLYVSWVTDYMDFAHADPFRSGFGATIGGGIATSSPVAPSSTGTVASATGSSGTGSSGSSSQNSSGGSGSSSPPAGAIAGGVVGGLVVIGIIVLLAVWLILRHRRQTKAAGSNSKAVAPDEPSSGTAQGVTSGPPKTSEATVQDAGVHEIAQNDRVHELNNNQKYPELP